MNKITLLSFLGFTALSGSIVFAQSTPPSVHDANQQGIRGAVNTGVGANLQQTKQEVQEDVKIKVRVLIVNDTIMEATFAEPTSQASQDGINLIKLDAIITDTKVKNKDAKAITFNQLSKMDEKGQKKSTPLDIPFKATLIPMPEIETGDVFEIEINPFVLMTAINRLNAKDEDEDEDKEEEKTKLAETSEQTGGNDKEEGRDDIFQTPDFAPVADPVVTTEACDIRVDIAQMVAIEQERTLIDGVEEAPCADTLVRYPITKKFNSCPLVFDTENMIANEQYVLNYTDPNSGVIQVQDCTMDEDKIIALEKTQNGCSVRHDFAQSLSYQQEQIVYEHNGATQILQPCDDSDTTFVHNITRNGCLPVIANDVVVFQEKITIDTGNGDLTIRDCQPNPATSTAVLEEECVSPKYTHDFTGNQSFLNKSFFYMDGMDKTYLQQCVSSNVSFQHQKETDGCSAINDDTTKETTLYAKTIINDGGVVEVAPCNVTMPKVPYISSGSKWQLQTQGNTSMTLSATDSSYTLLGGESGSVATPNWTFKQISGGVWVMSSNFSFSNGKKYPITTAKIPQGYVRHPYVSGAKYCMINQLTGNWITASGITIDKSKSTLSPTWSNTSFPPESWMSMGSGIKRYMPQHALTLSCSTPSCNSASFKAHPSYLRGDNSIYFDTSTQTGTLAICGDGSAIDGTDAN